MDLNSNWCTQCFEMQLILKGRKNAFLSPLPNSFYVRTACVNPAPLFIFYCCTEVADLVKLSLSIIFIMCVKPIKAGIQILLLMLYSLLLTQEFTVNKSSSSHSRLTKKTPKMI